MFEYIITNLLDHLPLVTLILLITWLTMKYLSTPKNLPPGPWGIPLFGYAPFLGQKPQVKVASLRKKYGDVIRINMGLTDIIFFNSYKVIKESLVKQADIFAIRPTQFSSPELLVNPGIIRNNGEMWADFRRFTLSTLRDFGFGKTTLEPQIKEEIEYFLKEVESHKGQAAYFSQTLQASVTNVICVVMTGQRFDYKNKMFNDLIQLSTEHITRTGIGRISSFIPMFLRVPSLLKFLRIKTALLTAIELVENLKKVVDKYEKLHELGGKNNFIDAWFTEAEKTGTKKTNHFTKSKLSGVLADLFLAGSDTTTNTLHWSLLYMVKHPEIQQKVQKEIDDVIGRERSPSMHDQKLMPYTEATLMEVHRIVSTVPLSLIHSVTKDTTVNGYFIPKDSLIMPNIWAVHNDEELFPESEKFKPARFLTDNRQLKKMEELIPFSMGKRQCMGESLARMELFLYFTSMLQRFTFELGYEGQELDFDFKKAVITKPNPQKLRAIIR